MAGNGFTAFRKIAMGSQYDRSGTGSTKAAALADKINFGTRTNPNRLMFGTMSLTPMQEFYAPEDEERNSIASIHRATPVSKHSEMRFEGSLQFERAPDLFAMAFGHPGIYATNAADATFPSTTVGVLDGVAQAGIGDPTDATMLLSGVATYRLWHYAPPMTEFTVPELYTFVYGDNASLYEMQDSMMKTLTLRYEMNNAVMVSAEFFGKAVVEKNSLQSTINSIKQARVNDAVSQNTDIYLLDNTAANRTLFTGPTISNEVTSGSYFARTYTHGGKRYRRSLAGLNADGAPAAISVGAGSGPSAALDSDAVSALRKSGLISSLNLTIPTGFEMTRYSSGSIDFTDYSQMRRSIQLEMTIRHSDAGRDQFEKFLSSDTYNRSQLLRLVTKHGNSVKLDSDGTVDANNGLATRRFIVFDMAMLYNDSPEFFTDVNGDNCFTMRGSSYHDPDWGRDFQAYVHTDVIRDLTLAHPA